MRTCTLLSLLLLASLPMNARAAEPVAPAEIVVETKVLSVPAKQSPFLELLNTTGGGTFQVSLPDADIPEAWNGIEGLALLSAPRMTISASNEDTFLLARANGPAEKLYKRVKTEALDTLYQQMPGAFRPENDKEWSFCSDMGSGPDVLCGLRIEKVEPDAVTLDCLVAVDHSAGKFVQLRETLHLTLGQSKLLFLPSPKGEQTLVHITASRPEVQLSCKVK
jgi:hypothetical protein